MVRAWGFLLAIYLGKPAFTGKQDVRNWN